MDRTTLEFCKMITENVLEKNFDFTRHDLERFENEFKFELMLTAEKIFYHFGELTPFERKQKSSDPGNRESFEEVQNIPRRN